MILSKRSDPRFGESTYRGANGARPAPDAALFQVPSDFKIIDSESKKQVTLDVEDLEELRRKIEELKKKVEGTRWPDDQ
jgi:hypothetical protein